MTPNEWTATQALDRMGKNGPRVGDLVRACLARIEAREGTVGAWEHMDPERVWAQVREIEQGRAAGALRGIPVGIKDVFDTWDLPTAYGSPIYRGHRPPWDASCVALLRATGAVILGKTVTTEFAAYHPGKTANPRQPDHTPGGSSSGSAAAVADNMVPLALGTQTAGSVIRPASFCGVVGYKPTFGWVARAGTKPLADSLDTIGWFARSVEDAALLASVLCGRPSLRHPPLPAEPPRIGTCRTHEWPSAEPATVAALGDAAQRLFEAGAPQDLVELPGSFRGLAEAQTVIMAYEAARSLAFEHRSHADRLSPKLLELIRTGNACPPERYDDAQKLARTCRASLDEVFGPRDALLVPSAPGEAPRGLSSTGDPVFNRIWTLLGVPCVNLPGLQGPRGLPVGVQLVGRPGQDERLLAVARWAAPRLAARPPEAGSPKGYETAGP